jgi:pimeloyl-ACP methyl ester carboxylesterase
MAELELNYLRRGSGETVVLLHGIGGELCVWEPVIGPVSAQREVIAIDLPGFGSSPALPPHITPTPGALAEAVGEQLTALGIDRPHLVGNSLGGWVALELARRGRAQSVLGLCPAGLWAAPVLTGDMVTRGRTRMLVRLLGMPLRVLLLSRAVRRVALRGFVAHPERIRYRAAWRMIHSYGRSTAYDATSTAMRRSRLEHPEEITVPVLLAFGARDRLIRPVTVPAPNFRSIVLPDCGHIPMWDDPDLIARLILETGSDAGGTADEAAAAAARLA